MSHTTKTLTLHLSTNIKCWKLFEEPLKKSNIGRSTRYALQPSARRSSKLNYWSAKRTPENWLDQRLYFKSCWKVVTNGNLIYINLYRYTSYIYTKLDVGLSEFSRLKIYRIIFIISYLNRFFKNWRVLIAYFVSTLNVSNE